MMIALLVVAMLGMAAAFRPLTLSKSESKSHTLSMVLVNENYPGQTSPLGFFDPLGLSRDVSEKRLKLWREAEIKHGRLAMLAAMGILVQERFNPLFGGRILGAGIYHFQQVNSVWPAFFLVILASIAFTEMYTILRGWESPADTANAKGTGGVAMLKDDYIPGDLGFDPLNFLKDKPEGWKRLTPEYINLNNKELNNGRLAMIGVAGMVAQELLDHKQIFEHISEFGFRSSL